MQIFKKLFSKNTKLPGKGLFSKPADLFLLVFLSLFSLGQLGRIELGGGVAIYLHDFMIVGWLVFVGFKQKNTRSPVVELFKILKKFFAKNRLFLLFLIWAIIFSLLGLFLGRSSFNSLLYIFRLFIYSLFIIDLALEKRRFSFSFKNGLIAASIFMSVMGILQYLFLPDVRFLNILGWDNHYYRLIGPLLDPAFMGMIAVLGLVGLESNWQKYVTPVPQRVKKRVGEKESRLVGIFLIVAELILVTTVALTFSRSSYLSLVIALGLLFWQKNWRSKTLQKTSKTRYFLLGLFFLITLPLLPKPSGAGVDLARTETIDARIKNSQAGLEVLEGAQWISGRGLFNNDNYKASHTYQHAQVPDNLLVFLLNGIGVVGTLLLVASFVKWMTGQNKTWWGRNQIWVIGLIAVLTHSMFNNTFLQPFVFLMLWGTKEIDSF